MDDLTLPHGPYLPSEQIRSLIGELEREFHHGRDRVVDCQASLERLEGDCELFQDLLSYFWCDSPRLLDQIRSAIRSGNRPALNRAAHTLKGLVSNFDANQAIERAFHLEALSNQGESAGELSDAERSGAARACEALEAEIARVEESLERFKLGAAN